METVALSKYAAEYELMLKWMVEFFIKFQGHGIKISRVYLICIAKPLILFNILWFRYPFSDIIALSFDSVVEIIVAKALQSII